MSVSFLTRKGSVGRSASNVSSGKAKKTALAVVSATAALIPLIAGSQKAMATLTWDPTGSGGTSFGGGSGGNWDTTAGNNVWWNGTADTSYATDTAVFTGTGDNVTVDTNVTTNGVVFGASGFTFGGTNTISFNTGGSFTTTITGASETFNNPILLGTGTASVDGSITFNGSVGSTGTGSAPILGAQTTDSATFTFTGDMSVFAGKSITIGGGNNDPTLSHLVTMNYESTAGQGVVGDSTTQLQISYQANLNVTQNMNIAGVLALTGGAQEGLGDLSQVGETITGTGNIDAGFNPNNGANTTAANGISGGAPLSFIAGNTGNFLTNDLSSGYSLTIGQAGASTAAVLSSTNAGRILTVAGSGTTVINSQLVDGNKSSLNYVNSILAYNGSGTLELTNPLNNYKGATYIEQGTVKIGATNALPTGQNLPAADTGGTPGMIVFGDTDSTKNAGGILDLNGFNQTVAGLGIQQATTVAAFQNAVWTVALPNGFTTTSCFLSTITGFTPYNCGLAIGEGVTIAGQSGTITFLANNGGTTQSLLIGLSFDPAVGSYSIGSGTVILSPGTATASNQIVGNSSTTSNSTLTFDGGNTGGTFATGEGVGSTSTFGGTIKDSVNGGTKQVSLVVGAGTLNLTGTNTYTGGTTVNGGANGAVLNVEGLIANNASSGVVLGTTTTFGAHDNIISRAVVNGGSFAGLGATETGTDLDTKVDLLQGANTSNGGTLMVSMEMRQQTATDDANLPANAFELASDVLGLTGMVIGGGASGQTDPFALQMTFNPGYIENIQAGSVYLAYTNNAESIPFSNAINGDFATGANALTDVQSSYAAFASANGITNANIGNYLGSWGVDTSGDTAWAIVDHNSQFAVVSVPEPATVGLLALSGVALLGRRSRRKAN